MWRKTAPVSNTLRVLAFLGAILLAVSFYSGHAVLFMLGIILLTIHTLHSFYSKKVDRSLYFQAEKRKIRLFKNDTAVLKLEFRNSGRLPILNALFSFTADSIIQVINLEADDHRRLTHAKTEVSLNGREKWVLPVEIRGKERGVAKIRSVHLDFMNLFGFSDIGLILDRLVPLEVIVLPEMIPVRGAENLHPLRQGGFQTSRSLFDDTALPAGVKEYSAGDPMNRINWKQSAKRDELQTRRYEKTAELSWTILINIKEGDSTPFSANKDLETIIGHVAYLCHFASKRNIPYELYVNIRSMGRIPFMHLQMGEGKEQLAKALELLARVEVNSVITPYEQLLFYINNHHRPAPYIIHAGNGKNLPLLLQLKRAGRRVYSFSVHPEGTSIREIGNRVVFI